MITGQYLAIYTPRLNLLKRQLFVDVKSLPLANSECPDDKLDYNIWPVTPQYTYNDTALCKVSLVWKLVKKLSLWVLGMAVCASPFFMRAVLYCPHLHDPCPYICESRGGQEVRTPPPLKNHKNIGFFSNTDPDSLKITKLSGQHSMLGHHRHASETPPMMMARF